MDGMETTPTVIDDDDDDDDGDGRRTFTKELWFLVVLVVALALLLKAFFVQAFFIPSGSMEKTLHGCPRCHGDRVLVNKLVYHFRDIHRGEVVVFNGKGTNFTAEAPPPPKPSNVLQRGLQDVKSLLGLGSLGDKDFIKRVIGIPGDVVACCDSGGHVTVNGQPLDEPYVYLEGGGPQATFGPITVPKGQLFLMGDHRDGSSDSRYNGPVPEKKVVGRAFAVFYPVQRWKVLRVPATFDPTKHAAMGGTLPASGAAPPVLALAVAAPVTVVRRRLRRRTD